MDLDFGIKTLFTHKHVSPNALFIFELCTALEMKTLLIADGCELGFN